jgi:hypothetical protein
MELTYHTLVKQTFLFGGVTKQTIDSVCIRA